MRSLTNRPVSHDFPDGKGAQARFETTSQRTSQAGRKRSPRGTGIYSLLVFVLFATGLAYGGYFERLRSSLAGPFEDYLRSSGLILHEIHIRGQETLSDEQIIAALGIRPGQSMIGYDAAPAQQRLARLGRIRSARVMRLLPSALLVEIRERQPFVRWLHEGRIDIIDRDGIVLGPAGQTEYRSLPLVAGRGAAEKAAHLVRILSAHEQLARRIKFAERIEDYRWNLHIGGATVIKLPPHGVALGLARLIGLPDRDTLLARSNTVVDLRHPDRIYVGSGASRGDNSPQPVRRSPVRS